MCWWIYEWMDGWTDEQTYSQIDGWMHRWVGWSWMNEWMDGWIVESMVKWMGRSVREQKDGWMGQMDEWMDGQVNRHIARQTDGCIDGWVGHG